MDDNPISLENILEQAPKWTFASDCTLLQWMKQISQDLENKATNTSNALDKLNNNIKSTNIALDNVANSLTALQFGNQFVENRVQDDDETLENATEPSKDNEKPSEELTPEEILKKIMENNLKVLRNCHEKYFIDLEDSDDDDENPKEKTCVYRPINPYNERPLPYIIGSKEWHDSLHVGLSEDQQESSYSGDEISETFSKSSSTSHVDDNESFESNTEWVSSNSIDNDNLNANIEAKNASSLQGSQPLHPETPLNIKAAKSKTETRSESSSISTTSSSFAKKSLQQTTKQNENLTQRSESINSISSKSSSKTKSKITSDNRENVLQYKSQTQKFVDLFAEPAEYPESIASSSVSSTSNRMQASEDNRTIRRETDSVLKTQPPPFLDLFTEPPEDVISPSTSSMFSNQNTKRKTVNLFDDDDDNMTDEDLLAVLISDEQLEKLKTEENPIIKNKPSIGKTSKSLFDDSDDDDDFLKAFLKKPSPKEATKSSLAKTLLFDNEIHGSEITSKLPQTDNANNNSSIDITSKNNYTHKKIKNIFDDNEDNESALLFSSRKIEETKDPIKNPTIEVVSQSNKNSLPVTNLFNKPIVLENVKDSEKEINNSNNENNADNIKSHKISKKINLFDDLDEEGDLFSTKLKKNADTSQQTAVNENSKKSEAKSMLKKEVDVNKLNEMKSKNLILNKEHIKPNESARDDDNIPQKRASEIIENEATTESLRADNNLLAKDKLSELPRTEEHTQTQKELSNNKRGELTHETLAAVPENVTQKPNSSNKYDFSSVLFLDEPPDDDNEFFETLAKTPSILNRNYNAIDLENDIYEPELPKVPAASTSNNQTDTTENFYTGLQLFSDIPPDDDAGSIPDVIQTKRLHSVFYDDFNETLMALNQQHAENEILKHSIFSDEPPPMDEVPKTFNKDVTDHKVPDDKQDTINEDHKTKTLEAGDKNTSEFSNSRPVSKLQMPNININVQALLPGGHNTLRKAKEDNLKSNVINDDIESHVNIQKDFVDEHNITISKSHVEEAVHRTAETEHILTNITKNRIKAPASRRPSTRRARQENYRKSLIEQEQSLDSGNEKSETENDTTKEFISQGTSLQKHTLQAQKQNTIDKLNVNFNRNNISNVTSSTPKLFQHEPQDDPRIGQDISTKENDDCSTSLNKKINTQNEAGSLLFSDEEEDDDDFFKHIKTSNMLEAKATNVKADCENITTKPSLEKCEDDNKSMEITKDSRDPPPSMAEEFAKEAAPREITTTEYEKNQPTSTTGISKMNTPIQSDKRQLKSFLDSDDDDNDIFKKNMQQPTYSTRNKDKNSQAKSQFKSFLDSETDEESNIAGLQTTTTTTSENKKNTEIPKVSMRTTKDTKAKLFSDSESDSDDLFRKLPSTKTSSNKTSTEPASKTQTTPQLQPSLFDSGDSDSNDFLASSASLSKTTSSKSALKKNVPKTTTQTITSLFSDLDSDDDDLFGGATVKVTTTNVTNIKNVKSASTSKSTASTAEVSKSKTVDDNPLADLL